MERVGIYAGHGNPFTSAVEAGCRRLDMEPAILYDSVWTPAGTRRDLDRIVVIGESVKSDEIAEFWSSRVPTARLLHPIIPEVGRAFVGAADPSWLPADTGEASARLEEWWKPKAPTAREGAVLVMGRRGGHRLMRNDIEAWAVGVLATLRRMTNDQILWLPDPREAFRIGAFDETLIGVPEARAMDRARVVVSDGAPGALTALRDGLPVIYAGSAPCVYSVLCGTMQEFGGITARPASEVEQLFAGILAAQHTAEELATGAPLTRAWSPGDRLVIAPMVAEEVGTEDPPPPPPPVVTQPLRHVRGKRSEE